MLYVCAQSYIDKNQLFLSILFNTEIVCNPFLFWETSVFIFLTEQFRNEKGPEKVLSRRVLSFLEPILLKDRKYWPRKQWETVAEVVSSQRFTDRFLGERFW